MKRPLTERLLTLLYPRRCFLCHSEAVSSDAWICETCAPTLPITTGKLCRRCGKALEDCRCKQSVPYYDGAAVPLFYTDAVAKGIFRFKYNGKRYYSHFLADLMADSIRETFDCISFSAITYVPLHPEKRRRRGFCQTQLLAQELSQMLDIPIESGFLRHTGKGGTQMEQKGLDARRKNARHSFSIRKDAKLDGKNYLLVDDVLTTGSTADRCAFLMHKKGAEAVYLAAAATTCYHHSYEARAIAKQ